MGVKIKGISEVDGGTVEIRVSGSEEPNVKIVSSFTRYTHNANPTPPPNSGQIRGNSDDPAAVTEIWIHRMDFDNRDMKFFFMQLKEGMQLYLQDLNDAASYGIWTMTADAIDENSYITLPVTSNFTGNYPLQGTGVLIGIFS
jgi:hypothetical protein